MKIIDLIGKRFGRLVVTQISSVKKNRRVRWDCVCDCGNTSVVIGAQLRDGRTKSCGCLNREISRLVHTTHGASNTPEERALREARRRCNSPKWDAKYWIDGSGRSPSEIAPVYRERAWQLHRENFSVERVARPESQLTPPAIGRLTEIKAPTMVVIGDNDSEDLRTLADRLAAEISGARLAQMRNAAHLPSLEHPAEFNRLLEEFLGSLPTRT